MRHPASAWYYKLLAWVLAFACLASGAFFFIVGFGQANGTWPSSEKAYQTSWQCANRVRYRLNDIISQFWRNPNEASWKRLMEDSDLRFIILDEQTGKVVQSYVEGLDITVPDNLAENVYLKETNRVMRLGEADSFLKDVYVMDYYFGTEANGDRWAASSSAAEMEETGWYDADTSTSAETAAEVDTTAQGVTSYQMLLLLPQKLHTRCTDVIAQGYDVYRQQIALGRVMPVVLALSCAGLLAAVIFLCIQSGRKPDRDTVEGTVLERAFLELHLLAGLLAFMGGVGLLDMIYDGNRTSMLSVSQWYLVMILGALGAAACALVLVELILTVVLRAKLGKLWTGTLSCRLLRLLGRVLGWLRDILKLGFRSIGLFPQAILCVLAIAAVELVGIVWVLKAWSPEFPLLLLVIFNILLLLALFWVCGQLKLLQKGAGALAEGDLDYRVDTRRMYWAFRQHGENLNAISDGMGKAVEKQMKSERLKGELITNVSHDIKTPLTSIINYVDLLQKAKTEAERIQYLEVLERQSRRLKRLTENLVEASKASTGNLAVSLAPTSVMELVNQSVEEYRDRLEAGKLEIVISQRGDLSILADGKLMWRIMDNLLSNVVKYALPGTRVYVTAQKDGDRVVIAVKNISRDPLNVAADELMERFVRGDSSRHTEGTGLGLNIAQSLTTLQNGLFTLTVDGDLFKAEVSMPVANDH